MRKKKYLFLTGYFVIIAAIAACIYVNNQKEQTDTAKETEDIELTLVAADRDITWNAVTDYVITQFEEENPGIKIKKRVDEREVLYETYLRSLALSMG